MEKKTYALRSWHVGFSECDGAAASSPDAASSAAALSKGAAPPPAPPPAGSSLSPVSRSICAGSQLQRPQKLRVTALMGCGQVSLLSLLASKGWTFTCSPGKSRFRTSREADKPAKPPCLSLSHFGGHDQVPNRTRSSRTHLDIFLWCNVPWISIVHPGAVDIDMSSSLRSLQYMSDVDPSSHRVVRYSTMHDAVQDSVLHVAERDGSSSVHERIECADPVQPRFRRVEHAFGCLGRYHGVERREEEGTESGNGHGGTDGTHAGHCDRPSRTTGCGKGSIGTKGRYRIGDGSQRNYRARGRDTKSCPCHDGTRGEYRSDREASGTGRKGKGIGNGEARIRSSKGSARARDPREAFCRDSNSSGGNVRAGGDISNESLVQLASSSRPERRREKDQKSSQTASAETAAPCRSDRGTSASSSKGAITVTVVDCVKRRPGAKGVDQESVETTHQSPSEGADCEAAPDRARGPSLPGYRKGRVHGAEQAPSLDRAKEATATGIVGVACEKGVHRDQALKGSHDGEPDSFRSIGCRGYGCSTGECSSPERSAKEPTVIRPDGSRAGHQRDHHQDRHHAGRRCCRKEARDQTWDCFLYEAPQEKEKVKFTSQVRSLLRPADNSALSVTDASTSEWTSETADPPVLELTEENLKRLDESVKQRRTPSILPIKAKSRPIGPQPPPGPPPGWQPPAKQPPVAPAKQPPVASAKQPPVAPPKQPPVQPPAPPAAAEPEEIPEPKTPSVPGPKTPPTKPKAKSRPLIPKSRKRWRKKIWLRKPKICSGKQRGVPRPSRERRSPRRRDQARRRYRRIWST